jgi:two-component system, NtrC family, sensor kinase
MATTQDEMIAELQRTNLELRQERDTARAERDAALAQRNSEFGERIEQQSATIDVLKVMSESPGDPQPVFDLITRRAAELCNSRGAAIYEYAGELVHFRSRYHRPGLVATASAFSFGTTEIAQADRFFAAFPMKPERGVLACRAILDRQVIHARDTQAEPELLPSVRDLGIRSILAIPLMRDDNAVGAFAINSEEPGGFTDSQVALLQTFAEQAVIAITSAETYRALQARTADLQETLEYQTATGDVLKVISRSTFDLQPVLDTVVETAARLCDADMAAIYHCEGDGFQLVTNFGLAIRI